MWFSKEKSGEGDLGGNVDSVGQVYSESDDNVIMSSTATHLLTKGYQMAHCHHDYHRLVVDDDEDETNPEVLEISANGTMVVSYPLTPNTLAKIREYQHNLRSTAPGWTSMLDLSSVENRIVLKVFPISNTPNVLLSRPHVYR